MGFPLAAARHWFRLALRRGGEARFQRSVPVGFHHDALALSASFHFSQEIGAGEPVTLHSFGGDEALTAIVRLPDQFHEIGNGSSAAIRGDVLLPESAKDKVDSLNAITLRGIRFQIENVAPPIDGHVKLSVTHTDKEQTNSAAIDAI